VAGITGALSPPPKLAVPLDYPLSLHQQMSSVSVLLPSPARHDALMEA
jgi:hypothetical protein